MFFKEITKYNFNMTTLIRLFDTYAGRILNYYSETLGYVKTCEIEKVDKHFWRTSYVLNR